MPARSELRTTIVTTWEAWDRRPESHDRTVAFLAAIRLYLEDLAGPIECTAFHRHISGAYRRGLSRREAVLSWRWRELC
jgi:hypothetical protein